MKERLFAKERLSAIGLGLALALGATGCSTSQEAKPPSSIDRSLDPEPTGLIPEEIASEQYREWLEPAEVLLKKSDLPEAKSLLDFISDKVILKSKPNQEVPDGKVAIQLVRSYKEMPENNAQILRDPFSIIIFNQVKNTIYLDNNLNFSRQSKGVALMHELFHALKDHQTGNLLVGKPSAVNKAIEEVRVYDLMFKVFDDAMSEEYQEYIDANGKKIEETKTLPESIPKEDLERFFGNGLTDFDVSFLGIMANRHAFYRLAEKVNPTAEKAHRIKIRFQLDQWETPPELREDY